MSGIQAGITSIPSVYSGAQPKAQPVKVDKTNSVSISVPKDSIANLGKGLATGSVPAAGIVAIALKVSGSAVEHMGDGGLDMALMGMKPVMATSLAGGTAGVLVAPELDPDSLAFNPLYLLMELWDH